MKLVLLLLVTLTTGCATTLSSLQTARPAKRGQVVASVGGGFYANLGPVSTIVEQAVKQAGSAKTSLEDGTPYSVSEEDQQDLLTAGIALAVMTPSAMFEGSVRTGVLPEDLDVGIRYSVSAFRLDTKYRFFHSQTQNGPEGLPVSLDLALGVAGSRFMFASQAFKVLEFVQLDNFSRWDVEVPVYASVDFGEIFGGYVVPKYVYSNTQLDQRLVNYSRQATNLSGTDLRLPSSVDAHFFGGTLGAYAGYRYAHLFVELTGGYTRCVPKVMGRERSLSGLTVYPAVGVGLRLP